ncbi:hypothetical protein C2869_02425 [Saccharobesus litoralis]|uniref:histidine kinase n=1 Tax=Saccharobesus litoralis TaxID=2172099 RepID=A0A2S0VMC0_9ALTE|nr:ATP-binding protein [Saccharobesus litoralis]AWB65364.1 hypothetical protein C2869_02425 [Saccharobesus litoralis]
MSDQPNEKITALENILKRERAARKQIEQKLEEYSRQAYFTNQELENKTSQTLAKQTQLEFLTGISAETWKQDSIDAIIQNYLERSATFLQYPVSVFFHLGANYKLQNIKIIDKQGTSNATLISELFANLDCLRLSLELEHSRESQLLPLNEYLDSRRYRLPFSFAYFVPLYYLKQDQQNVLGITCFLYANDEQIDIDKLQTIESSRSTLTMALERKRAEQALQRQLKQLQDTNKTLEQTQQQLIETEKLASLGLLSAGVAHEINNPVGYVTSNLQTMAEYVELFQDIFAPLENETTPDFAKLLAKWQEEDGSFLLEDSKEILTTCLGGLDRIKEIVAALRAFSRMDNHELEPTDINQVLTHALKMVQNELKYDYQIITEFNAEKLILGSESQLQQVFINLFINAKHAMPDGGKLTIKTYQQGGRIKVSIKDEGCGISEENQKHIFTPFFTTKPQGQGTGLGLSISYSILQQHHAKVEINSEIDVGTEFILAFFVFE